MSALCCLLLACTASTSDSPFDDIGSLDCEELYRLWGDYLDPYLDGRQDCVTDEDCVWVRSDAICGDVSIQTCGAAVADEWEAQYTAAWSDGREALCSARTQPCNTAPLCPAEPSAVCFEGRCHVR